MMRCIAIAFLLFLTPSLVSAQTPRPSAAEAREKSELNDFWNAFRTLRSECDNASWVLWHSNSYEKWRTKKTPILSMHYNTRSFEKLPLTPQTIPESIRERASKSMQSANEIVATAGKDFSMLADYINAKDYEDDKFKKGDELNRRLVQAGRGCFTQNREMTEIFSAYVQERAPRLASTAPDPQLATQMIADWHVAREIAVELAKNEKVDIARLGVNVAQLSELMEKRMAEPKLAALSFYKTLNKDVAVELRKYVREAKESAKKLKELAEDRPRVGFNSVRETIELGAANNLLSDIGR